MGQPLEGRQPNFLSGASAATDRADLINFLWSIDASTTEQAVPTGFDNTTATGQTMGCLPGRRGILLALPLILPSPRAP